MKAAQCGVKVFLRKAKESYRREVEQKQNAEVLG